MLLVDAKSGKRRELIREGDVAGLSFAPDRASLAYAVANGKVGRKYRADIFVIHLSDGQITQLTRDGHSERPVWDGAGSSSGASISMVNGRSGGSV